MHCSTLGNSESEDLRDTIEVVRFVNPLTNSKKMHV